MKSRALPYVVKIGILVAVYVGTARLGLSLDAVSGFATAVWPPTGISLVALFLLGYRLWPGVSLGAFLVNHMAGAPLLAAAGMAAGNTLEALFGAYLLQRVVGFQPSLARLRDVLGLAGAALISTPVSATLGVTSGSLGGVIPWASYGRAWWTWWVGDILGDLVLAAVLFTWSARPHLRLPARRGAEAAAVLVTTLAAGWLVFGDRLPTKVASYPYLPYPCLIWAAVRFGPLGAAAGTGLVSAVAIWGTARGLGPFAGETLTLHQSLLSLQTFMGVAAVTVLLLAAAVSERQHGEEALLRSERRFRDLAEELARAGRAKDHFLAMLAHELRNPLAGILNGIELLKEGGPADSRLARAREIIERQAAHQAHLLDDLFNVSSIARGKIALQPIRLDLARLVRDTAEDHRRSLEAAGLSLLVQVPAEPLWVTGDPTRLAQVIDNLLQNAAKFTDGGGHVTVAVTAEPEGRRLGVEVRDTGIGIEPELLAHVFEAFTQGDQRLERRRGGLGLGLALVKGLVELHGGDVQAESEGPGRGAVFTVWLARAEGLPAPAAQPADARPAPVPRRVLVVEDNEDAAETLRELLEIAGHAVAVANSGPEGIATARQFQPEVVLCDLGLPGMDGCAVATALRQDPATAGACLIALSGYGQERDRLRTRAAGFNQHLVKPVRFAELERHLAGLPVAT